jgi:hypothetical protein
MSIFIGISRLEVEIDDSISIKYFIKYRTLVEYISKSADLRVSSIYIIRIDTVAIPPRLIFASRSECLMHIIKLFPDAGDLTIIIWYIGNCLVNPILKPQSIIICGLG